MRLVAIIMTIMFLTPSIAFSFEKNAFKFSQDTKFSQDVKPSWAKEKKQSVNNPRSSNRGVISHPDQVIDVKTGTVFTPAAGGVTDPRDGTFYQDVGGGYVNTKTGHFHPKQ